MGQIRKRLPRPDWLGPRVRPAARFSISLVLSESVPASGYQNASIGAALVLNIGLAMLDRKKTQFRCYLCDVDWHGVATCWSCGRNVGTGTLSEQRTGCRPTCPSVTTSSPTTGTGAEPSSASV